MFERIEQFLFDVLGLLIPGLVMVIILVSMPLLIFDFIQISIFFNFPILGETAIALSDNNRSSIVGLIMLLSYILGHAVKVFSKYPYSFLRIIFDNGLFKIFNFISKLTINYLHKKLNNDTKLSVLLFLLHSEYRSFWKNKIKEQNIWYIEVLNFLILLYYFIKNVIKDIFSFETPNYFSANENIKKEVVKKLNDNYKTDFPDNWYSVYKISNIILSQKGLNSLSFKFLAKYNFYRSLSLIFLANYFYILFLYNLLNQYVSDIGSSIYSALLIFNSILWITFHEKYKRYWTLCGNESLMNLFYFLISFNNTNECEVEHNA